MTQPLTVVILSTGLENFKELRTALSADSRVQLLAGGDDADQLHEEITRLKPMATIISLGPQPDHSINFIKRLSSEFPGMAIVSAHNASRDLLLQSLRAGAREFLQLPVSAPELGTVVEQVAEFCHSHVEAPKKAR